MSDLLLALAVVLLAASKASSLLLYSSYLDFDYLSGMDLIVLFKSSFDCFVHCLASAERRRMD